MTTPRRCSECGNPIRVLLNPETNPRSRHARMGKTVALKGHDLCRKCWRGLIAQAEAITLAMERQAFFQGPRA